MEFHTTEELLSRLREVVSTLDIEASTLEVRSLMVSIDQPIDLRKHKAITKRRHRAIQRMCYKRAKQELKQGGRLT